MEEIKVNVTQDDGGVEVMIHYNDLSIIYGSLRQDMTKAIQQAYEDNTLVFHGTHICTADDTSYSYVKIKASKDGDKIIDRLINKLESYELVQINYQ